MEEISEDRLGRAKTVQLYRSRTVESLADLIAQVVEMQRTLPPHRVEGSERRTLWFRGQSSVGYNLIPSVFRNVPTKIRPTVERQLTHRFRARAAMHLPREIQFNDRARWLAIMQHHRLPTRLLDWSRSLMVAAFFATEQALPTYIIGDEVDAPQRDAAVWAVNPFELNEATCPSEKGAVGALESGTLDRLTTEPFYEFDAERRAQLGGRPLPIIAPAFAAAYSVETDIRMFVQRGAFTIHGHETKPMELDPKVAPLLSRFVIPSDRVARVAEEVAACGFAEADVYPDLDHLAAELVRTSSLPWARRFPGSLGLSNHFRS